MKAYDFRYKSKGQRLSEVLQAIAMNMLLPIIPTFVIWVVLLNLKVTKYFGAQVYFVTLLVVLAIGIVLNIRMFRNYQGVILYDGYLEISRYYWTGIRDRMNIVIPYNSIKRITTQQVNRMNIRQERNEFRRYHCTLGADYDNYVKLFMKNGRRYYFSVENQSEFIEEVHQQIKDASES